MRIALLTRRFNPSGGGTERDLSITARCLRAAGHEVSIYAEEVRAPSVDFAVERVSGLRLPRTLAVLRFGLLAASRARRDGADLVVSFARVVGADVLRSGGGSHASYVRAARRWQSGAAALAMRVFPYHRAQIFIEKRGFKWKGLRKALAVSNFVADDLTRSFQLPADRVLTLYNGVDLERFSPHDEAARARARDRYRIPGDARVVVFVGNGFARKGLGFLIDALPAMRHEAYLLVIGNDREVASFKRRAKSLGVAERATFVGGQSEIASFLAAADALALPSLFEPFGNVVLEAMAAGVPALSSAWCGVAEVMPAEMREFVVEDAANPDEIAERLDRLLDRASDLRQVARKTAERFTWDRYGHELSAVIASL